MTTRTIALLIALATTAAPADEFIFTKKEAMRHPELKVIRSGFKGFKDGKVIYSSDEPPPDLNIKKPVIGTFSGNVAGVFPSFDRSFEMPITKFEKVTFDGNNDWLTVVMKNGDVVRGHAESMTPTTLRLRDAEKAVRMSNVREIVATEPPAEPAPE